MLEKGDYIKEPIDNEAKIRINITLPKSLVEAIDTISDNRSKFLADHLPLRAGSFLIELARKKVFEEFGINLENEVIII